MKRNPVVFLCLVLLSVLLRDNLTSADVKAADTDPDYTDPDDTDPDETDPDGEKKEKMPCDAVKDVQTSTTDTWNDFCQKGPDADKCLVQTDGTATCTCKNNKKFDGLTCTVESLCDTIKEATTSLTETWGAFCKIVVGGDKCIVENEGSSPKATCTCKDNKKFDGSACKDPCHTKVDAKEIWIEHCATLNGICTVAGKDPQCVNCTETQIPEDNKCKEPCDTREPSSKTVWKAHCLLLNEICLAPGNVPECKKCEGNQFPEDNKCEEPCNTKPAGKEEKTWNDFCGKVGAECDKTVKTPTCTCPDQGTFFDDQCIAAGEEISCNTTKSGKSESWTEFCATLEGSCVSETGTVECKCKDKKKFYNDKCIDSCETVRERPNGNNQNWTTFCGSVRGDCDQEKKAATCKCKDSTQMFLDNECKDSCETDKSKSGKTWRAFCTGLHTSCDDDGKNATCKCPEQKQFIDDQCKDSCQTKNVRPNKEEQDWTTFCKSLGGTCDANKKEATCNCSSTKKFENQECRDTCATVQKRPNENNQNWTEFCASVNSSSCDELNKAATCKCKDQTLKFHDNKCIATCAAVKSKSNGKDETWKVFCESVNSVCDEQNKEATCKCKDGTLKFHGNKCIDTCATEQTRSDGNNQTWTIFCATAGGSCDETDKKATCKCPPKKLFHDNKCIDYNACLNVSLKANETCQENGLQAQCIPMGNFFTCECLDNTTYYDPVNKKCENYEYCPFTTCEENRICNETAKKCECRGGFKEVNETCEAEDQCPNKCGNVACRENKLDPLNIKCNCPKGFKFDEAKKTCSSIACQVPSLNDCQYNCEPQEYVDENTKPFTCDCNGNSNLLPNGTGCDIKPDAKDCVKECVHGVCVKGGAGEECLCQQHYSGENCSALICETTLSDQTHFCPNCVMENQKIKCICDGKKYTSDGGDACIIKKDCDSEDKMDCASKGADKCTWNEQSLNHSCHCVDPKTKNEDGICVGPCGLTRNQQKCAPHGAFCVLENEKDTTCKCLSTYLIWNAGTSTCDQENFKYKMELSGVKDMSGGSYYYSETKLDLAELERYMTGPIGNLLSGELKTLRIMGYEKKNGYLTLQAMAALKNNDLDEGFVADALKKIKPLPNGDCIIPPNIPVNCTDFENSPVGPALDPCEAKGTCEEHAECKKRGETNFYCKCQDGFVAAVPSAQYNPICKDTDECVTKQDCVTELSTCLNTMGSYECKCKAGYIHNTSMSGEDRYRICYPVCNFSLCAGESKCEPSNTEGLLMYKCNCPDGKMGQFCDENKSNNNGTVKIETKDDKKAGTDAIVVGCVLGALLLLTLIVAGVSISKLRKKAHQQVKGQSNRGFHE